MAGYAAGLPALPLPPPGLVGAGLVALAALTLDAARVRPLAVRRQVPVAWSRLFEPEAVALLYGARLGIGPLTLLNTWLWWGAFLLGAWSGPLAGMAVGAAFALTRTAVTLGHGTRQALLRQSK